MSETRPTERDLDSFCDVRRGPDAAKALTMPALDQALPPLSEGRPRWINLWATWCRPCIEEMPRLLDWERRLATSGAPIDMIFVSIDENAEEVTRYRRDHPEAPPSHRLAEASALEGLLTSLGLDAGATIPIQIILDGQGRARCVRSGGVEEGSYRIVRHLLVSELR